MDYEQTALQLASLGHPQRLEVFHRLIQAGPDGMTIGAIQASLDRPLSTVSFHLRELVAAGMVVQAKEGRSVRCRASFATLQSLLAIITRSCCEKAA